MGSHSNAFYIVSDLNDELSTYILNYYQNHEKPKEVLLGDVFNTQILTELLGIIVTTPVKGKKKDLVNLASTNAKITAENEMKRIIVNKSKGIIANEELANILNLDNIYRIDAFDNSNLFGSFSVSGMVVFINGNPNKSEYRKYKIMVDKNDDYHMMQEVIYRRYYRALVDKLELPNLILVDGGINQINACKDVLNSLNLRIKVCGLQKNDKHQTSNLIDGDTYSIIDLNKTSNVFHYLTRIQDEVHRYTINYHRQIRSKGAIASVLDEINGIGPSRKKNLIKKFGSIKKIKEATIDELSTIIPIQIAEKLKKFLLEKKL
jgi:excinuclease ABC subunit C